MQKHFSFLFRHPVHRTKCLYVYVRGFFLFFFPCKHIAILNDELCSIAL